MCQRHLNLLPILTMKAPCCVCAPPKRHALHCL
jgi:hypothetical protein